MNDIRRTKDQLIQEIRALRRKTALLEKRKEKHVGPRLIPGFSSGASAETVPGAARSISDRKHAERMLDASEKRFRSALEGMQLIGVMLNRKGEITFCNDFLLDLTGWKRKEVLGKSWFRQFLPPETRAHIRKTVFLKTIHTGDFPLYYQNEILTRDGKRRLIAWNNTVLKDAKGEVVSVTSIGEDITERTLMERALCENEIKFRSVFENSIDAIFLTSPDGKILAANPAACRLTGLTEKELYQKGRSAVIDTTDPRLHAALEERARTGKFSGELNVKRKDGTTFAAEVSSVIFGDAYGHQRTSTVIRDITERKQMEETLREREEKYRQLFNAESDAIIVLEGASRKFIDVNAAAVQLYGYCREEFLDMFLRDISAEPDESERTLQQILDGKIMRVPLRYHRKKNSTVFPVEVSAGSFIMNERQVVIGAVRDISERMQAEDKINRYHERLSELASKIALIAEDERRRFADELHDLTGQNLALAKIKISELRDSLGDKEIQDRLDELHQLIEEASASTRALTFELSPPILYEIGFEAAAEWLGEQILRKYNIAFHFENDTQTKPLSDEAKVLLFVSLRELIVNIAKHAKARNATVRLHREGNNLHVSLSDDGIGFDASTLDFQIMKATTFGLFSTRERMERLGGRLEIASQPGQGTTVTMVVPLKE